MELTMYVIYFEIVDLTVKTSNIKIYKGNKTTPFLYLERFQIILFNLSYVFLFPESTDPYQNGIAQDHPKVDKIL